MTREMFNQIPDTETTVSYDDIVRKSTSQNKISCRKALLIAEENSVNPIEVGKAADKFGIKIIKCSLGLFGYENSPVQNCNADFHPELENLIKINISEDKLTCDNAFKIAHQLKIDKLQITSFCNSRGFKISKCKLGAFR